MEFVKTQQDIDAENEAENDADNDYNNGKKTESEREQPTQPTEKKADMIIPGHIHNIKETAAKQGHLSYEEFIAQGGDPDDYQTPEQFIALKGPLKRIKEQTKQIKRLEREFNERIDNLNKYHQQQLEAQKAHLMSQRDAAIDDYDSARAKAYQSQIDNLSKQYQPYTQPTTAQGMSQVLQDWNNDPANDWFKTDKAKATYASIQFEDYRNQGYDDATAIRLMESDVNRRFRDVNTNITGAPAMEKGSQPGKKATAPRKITMDDLTDEEKHVWKHSGSMWPSPQAFLKSVADSRGE